MKIWWVVCAVYCNDISYCFDYGYEGETMLDGIAKFWLETGSKWTDRWKITNCYEVSSI